MLDLDTSRILAIDPGETTGIAYIESGKFMWGMVAEKECFQSEVFIRSLTFSTRPTRIILETPPSQTPHKSPAQTMVFELLKSLYIMQGFTVETINPGLWKGLVERSKIDATHIRDATDIAMFIHNRSMRKVK